MIVKEAAIEQPFFCLLPLAWYVSGCFRLFQIVSDCFRLFQIVSDLPAEASSAGRLFQIVLRVNSQTILLIAFMNASTDAVRISVFPANP